MGLWGVSFRWGPGTFDPHLRMGWSFGKSDDFWIWSSFISVSASNLQAILYTVVEMRFLAPFQYVAFELPFHIPYQSGALIYTTSCNMATPHTLIVILLSHLHTLYNIIILTFVIAISLFLGCRRHCCSSTTAPMGGGQRCRKRWSQRGRWLRRRLHYYTKVGSRDRGLVAERSSLELLADVNHALCEAKSGALYGSSLNDLLNYRFKCATVVAATNYKTGDTKIRTDWTNMIWSRFATECSLSLYNLRPKLVLSPIIIDFYYKCVLNNKYILNNNPYINNTSFPPKVWL